MIKRFVLLLIYVLYFCHYEVRAQEQIIIKYKNVSDKLYDRNYDLNLSGNPQIDSISRKYNISGMRRLRAGNDTDQLIYVLRFPSNTDIDQLLKEYKTTGLLEYVERDYKRSIHSMNGPVIPNDPYFYAQWGMYNNGSFTLSPAKPGADIDMENAWAIEEGDSSVVVGIMDTGCKLDHPEFVKRIWINRGEIPNNQIDDDHNGYIDDVNGWNFVYNTNNPTDDAGHGTNVTGILGATGNNSIGYAGMDWNCKLMILKCLDSTGSGYDSGFSEAIYYAVNKGVRIGNLSIGGPSPGQTFADAVNYAQVHNMLLVAAMGNGNTDELSYPAAYPGVMAVGATNPNDTRAAAPFCSVASGGSNYGTDISVMAPGSYIFGLYYLSDTIYDYYFCGTSQATPYVSGLAALLLAQDSSRTWFQIKTIIELTAQDQVGDPSEDTPGWDQYYGYGRINAYQALANGSNLLSQFNNRGVVCYPNPTKGFVNVLFSNADFQNATYTITDVLGKTVATGIMQNQLNTIELPFASGMYLVNLSYSGNHSEKVKIIVE